MLGGSRRIEVAGLVLESRSLVFSLMFVALVEGRFMIASFVANGE